MPVMQSSTEFYQTTRQSLNIVFEVLVDDMNPDAGKYHLESVKSQVSMLQGTLTWSLDLLPATPNNPSLPSAPLVAQISDLETTVSLMAATADESVTHLQAYLDGEPLSLWLGVDKAMEVLMQIDHMIDPYYDVQIASVNEREQLTRSMLHFHKDIERLELLAEQAYIRAAFGEWKPLKDLRVSLKVGLEAAQVSQAELDRNLSIAASNGGVVNNVQYMDSLLQRMNEDREQWVKVYSAINKITSALAVAKSNPTQLGNAYDNLFEAQFNRLPPLDQLRQRNLPVRP